MRSFRSELWPLVFAGLLGCLLVVLAVLQQRWLNRVSEAETERVRTQIERGAAALAAEVNHELARLAFDLMPHSQTRPSKTPEKDRTSAVATQLERWRLTTAQPDLVAKVWSIELHDHVTLALLDEVSGTFVASPSWPTDLSDLQAPIEARTIWRPQLDPRIPALILPITAGAPFMGDRLWVTSADRAEPTTSAPRSAAKPPPPEPPEPPQPPGFPFPGRVPTFLAFATSEQFSIDRWLVIQLDRKALTEGLLRHLADRHLANRDLHLRVFDGEGREIWSQGPVAPVGATIEKAIELLGPLQIIRPTALPARFEPADFERQPLWLARQEPKAKSWRLEIRHSAGSLEQAVARSRRNNLTLSTAILAILAASLLFLANNARSARRSARQQLELVAGITHELLTPLAALRSAGQNLEDGIVREPEKVGRYGRLIVDESQRLADLVQQALAFAGLEGRSLRLVPITTGAHALVEGAIDELRPLIEKAQARVDLDAPEPDLLVRADPSATRRVLVNLIANALKYGHHQDELPRLEISIRDSDDQVAIRVRDFGPGIDPLEAPKIFEPFFRGKEVVASAVGGAGLGLALARRLAEAGNGRLELEVGKGVGATFVLNLPKAEP